MNTPNIRPTRENWHEFCEEPDITEEEQREWHEMARAIREDKSGKLLDAVVEATKETTATANALAGAYSAEDWSDMVAWSDAATRDKRAELAWWRSYNARKPGAYYTPAHIYDGAQGSGGFLAAMGNPPYGKDSER